MPGTASLVTIATTLMVVLPVLSTMCGGEPADPWGDSGLGTNRDEQAGHSGPAWGYLGGEPAVVFRWSGQDRSGSAEWGIDGSIYAIREDGTALTLISPSVGDRRALSGDRAAYDTSPAVSPGGTQVVYATLRHSEYPGDYDIVTASLDGKERRQLTNSPESQSEPAWSPDGTHIAFLEEGEVHTMSADGSDVRNVAPGIRAAPEPPRWSPDGRRLAFRGYLDGTLYVVAADGSNLLEVAERTTGWSARRGRLAWSPDGRRIAFRRDVREPVPLPRQVYVVDVEEAEGDRRETQLARGFGPAVWSPDGAEILFGHGKDPVDTDPSLGAGLHAIAVEPPHHVRRVTEFGTNDILGLAWSPDGTRLAVLMRPFSWGQFSDVVLYTVALDGSDVRVLVRAGPEGNLLTEGESAR